MVFIGPVLAKHMLAHTMAFIMAEPAILARWPRTTDYLLRAGHENIPRFHKNME